MSPVKAQVPLGSSRHVSTRLFMFNVSSVETSVSSVSSRAVPTWRMTNNKAIMFACTSWVVFMLLHTRILFVQSNTIN